ncbi:MAG: hypothetical protein MO847_07610, partial [Candidatus Protistobacter heckmanni]|nr:hypothetical protein [Candidatus Protistobacter heckmanni]
NHEKLGFEQAKDKSPALTLQGEAVLRDAVMDALDGKPILRLPALTVKLGKLDVSGGKYELAGVALSNPEL